MAFVDSVNIGRPEPDPWKGHKSTGIGKRPVEGPVEVRAPGLKTIGLGSGLVGDFIGDGKHHGGDSQAVYAFQREDLDYWQSGSVVICRTAISARTSPRSAWKSTMPGWGSGGGWATRWCCRWRPHGFRA